MVAVQVDGSMNRMVWPVAHIAEAKQQMNKESAYTGWVDGDLNNVVNGKVHSYTLNGFGCKRVVVWQAIAGSDGMYIRRVETVIKA